MDLQLTDKVAVVTGANKGIGLAITQALAAEGALVVAGSLSTENLDGLDRVTAVAVDLLAQDGPALLVQKAIDEHGRLDLLVNNVGAVRIRVDGFLATSDEEFEWALRMDFFQPDAATVDYGVAKAAVVNLSKSLSQEFGPKGIRVNCVSPGQVSTDLWLGEHGVAATFANATGVDADTIRTTAAAAIATGRFTTPEEVATLVTMLASDRTANVTGVNYVIDGGLIKTT
jgi:NAD(P)-dependent dehydrogenase (short-subunit alcohol dehydrogenase family)